MRDQEIKIKIKDIRRVLGRGLGAMLILTACHKESVLAPAPEQTFMVNGLVRELEPDGKTVVIQHEAVSNYMAAMTMPFEVRDPNELRGLKPGDAITFRLIVTSKEGWIDRITNLHKAAAAFSAPSAMQISRAVAPLDEGDLLPDYHFTNELGEAVRLSQYKGQALALTFFFTSCPYPNFCPRLTSNFAETAAQLRQMPGGPVHWHLLSISFDPKTDTPQRLQTYAENAHYDPGHWSFLTGDPDQINELADQFGETFAPVSGTLSHNLRMVVVDASGRVRKIYEGNNWTSAELVEEMVKAAR
jgi:protein SCO1/2